MKTISTVLSVLAFIGVSILLAMQFSNKKDASTTKTSFAAPVKGGGRIAYIDIDTLQNKYELYKVKKEEFTKRQAAAEAELESSAKKMQSDYESLQKRAQAGSLSQSEGEAAQKRLYQMQQSLELRRQTLSQQLIKDQEAFNKDFQASLDKLLEEYNKDRGFDYILSYAKGGSILWANKQLDITNDVVEALNEMYKNEQKKK
jgi:outer membrane protein